MAKKLRNKGFVSTAVVFLGCVLLLHSHARALSQDAPSDEDVDLIQQALADATGCGSGLLGGYEPVDHYDEDLITLAGLAAREYASPDGNQNPELAACNPDLTAAMSTIQLQAACSQVVAGTNYVIAFTIWYPCTAPMQEAVPVTLVAKVFQPLPYENKPPTVEEVKEL